MTDYKIALAALALLVACAPPSKPPAPKYVHAERVKMPQTWTLENATADIRSQSNPDVARERDEAERDAEIFERARERGEAACKRVGMSTTLDAADASIIQDLTPDVAEQEPKPPPNSAYVHCFKVDRATHTVRDTLVEYDR